MGVSRSWMEGVEERRRDLVLLHEWEDSPDHRHRINRRLKRMLAALTEEERTEEEKRQEANLRKTDRHAHYFVEKDKSVGWHAIVESAQLQAS